jgi:D-alanine--poly(phosphoribitol) ligase subunit 2
MDNIAALESQITGFFATKLHATVPSPDADLVEAGILDSLALIELVMFLSQDLQVDVPLDDIDGFRSIRRIAGLVAAAARSD